MSHGLCMYSADERLIVCKNPALAEERKRKRAELLDATEQDLKDIQARIVRKRKPLRGADKIGLAVGALIGRRKVGKHFRIRNRDLEGYLESQSTRGGDAWPAA